MEPYGIALSVPISERYLFLPFSRALMEGIESSLNRIIDKTEDPFVDKTKELDLPAYQPTFNYTADVGDQGLVFCRDLEELCGQVLDDHIFPIDCSNEVIASHVTDRHIFPIDVPDEVIRKGYPTKLNEIRILPPYILESTHLH